MMEYQVVIEYDPETKHYLGSVVGIPEIVIDARSERTVIRMAREAIALFLEESAPAGARPGPARRKAARAKIVTVDV